MGGFSGVRLTDGPEVPSAFLPEEHSKAWWPCRPSLYSSLSPVALGHWSVSFKNLFIHFVVRFMFWKASQTSLGLEKAGLDSRFSLATCLPGRGGGRRLV